MKNDDESITFTCDKNQKAYAIEAGTIALVGSKLKNVIINCSKDKDMILKKTIVSRHVLFYVKRGIRIPTHYCRRVHVGRTASRRRAHARNPKEDLTLYRARSSRGVPPTPHTHTHTPK